MNAYKNQKLDEVKVFKDPVHRYVQVTDQVIWDLIATSEFQRLRRIKQLGTTYFTFHGAEHSRFHHSLGVYEVVRRMIHTFETYDEWNKDDRLLSLCAALLHDLGHGPFSHSFENVFALDHEKFTKKILLGKTEVNDVLEKVSPGFAEEVASIIDKTSANKLVISIISSQIDADRMDYLQRDAYFTGVSYGHFDMERILRVMRPYEDHGVIKSTEMHAVEDYIICRYQMYWQVYFHPVTRSSEVILTKTFHRVKELYLQGYQFKLKPTHFLSLFADDVRVEDYLQIDEPIVHFYFQQWQRESDPVLRDLCTRFMDRKLYKYIDYDRESQEEDYEELRRLFADAGWDPNYYLAIDSSSDLPYDYYESLSGERKPIYLLMPNNELKELSKHSVVVDSISGKKRTDNKLYYPEECLEQLPDNHPIHQLLNKMKMAKK